MASRMDEFRAFLTKYPGIVEDVKNGNHSWQQMYENWVVLGEMMLHGKSIKRRLY